MATTTNINNLKINVLTPEQYETAEKDTNQIYLIGNDTEYLTTVTKEYVDANKVSITGGASTIIDSNLTANRALVSNGSGKVAVSAVTSTELGYLDGVTSNIQTQLNNKVGSNHNHTASQINDFTSAVVSTVANSGSAKVAAGTYIGNPVTYNNMSVGSLTFDFVPKLVILHNGAVGFDAGRNTTGAVGANGWIMYVAGASTFQVYKDNIYNTKFIHFIVNNTTFMWYMADSSGSIHFNSSYHAFYDAGTTYNYLAIG